MVGLTLCVPVVASAPVHPLLAVQEVALVLDQVKVELLPDVIVVGFPVRATVGATTEETTVTVAVALLVGLKTEIALTVTAPEDGIDSGAVYRPAGEIVPYVALPPVAPFTCHVTAVFIAFATVALNA